MFENESRAELEERIRLLNEIALCAVALVINVEAGFNPPPVDALKRDLNAYRTRFGEVVLPE
jgi:hypothetical protein